MSSSRKGFFVKEKRSLIFGCLLMHKYGQPDRTDNWRIFTIQKSCSVCTVGPELRFCMADFLRYALYSFFYFSFFTKSGPLSIDPENLTESSVKSNFNSKVVVSRGTTKKPLRFDSWRRVRLLKNLRKKDKWEKKDL